VLFLAASFVIVLLFLIVRRGRQADIALSDSEQRFCNYRETGSDWFWETDRNHRFVRVSEDFARESGITLSQFIGSRRADQDIDPVHQESWAGHFELLERRESFRNFDYCLCGKDGPLWVRTSGVPLFDDIGEFSGYRGAGSDITREKMSIAAFYSAKEEAEQANRAKSELLANMSHELRTPLNAIIGFSEVMSERTFGEIGNVRYAEYPTLIRTSGLHLLQIISDLLDVSKVEAGMIELSGKKIDLRGVVDAVPNMVSERAAQAGVRINDDVAEGFPQLIADEIRVKQIIINLMSNAVKFTPSGGSVTLSADVEDDGGVDVSVADTGIGIPEEGLESVFEPFSQIENTFSRNYEGTGLGLSLVKELAKIHHGSVTIESEVGVGTCVTVRLPGWRVAPVEALRAAI
jgi:PAS domain S-box-containing protein